MISYCLTIYIVSFFKVNLTTVAPLRIRVWTIYITIPCYRNILQLVENGFTINKYFNSIQFLSIVVMYYHAIIWRGSIYKANKNVKWVTQILAWISSFINYLVIFWFFIEMNNINLHWKIKWTVLGLLQLSVDRKNLCNKFKCF